MLARLDGVVAEATTAFEGFDYARALERTEEFFWWFCDDYVELVKGRAYGSRGDAAAASARASPCARPSMCCSGCSPRRCPFAAEEAWSWWHDGSVHVARGRTPAADDAASRLSLDPISEVLASVRRVKTEAKVSQRAAVATLDVRGPADVARRDRGVPRRPRRGAHRHDVDARRGRTTSSIAATLG